MTNLVCSVCLFQSDGNTSTDAITIVNGQAVCLDHFHDTAQSTSGPGTLALMYVGRPEFIGYPRA